MLQIKKQQSYMRQRNRLGALLGAAALSLVLAGCSGGEPAPDTSAPPAPTMGASGGSSTSAAAGSGGGGAPGMMSGGSPGMGGAPGGGGGFGPGGTAAAGPGAKPANSRAVANARPDPFKPWWSTYVPPPPVLSFTEPVRIATTNTAAEEKPAGVEIQEVPNRRVAGILNGNGVYALLDNFGGSAEVVKPGQVLTDGYVVSSINATSVVLKKVIDNRTYTQVVPLTDAGSTVTQFGGPQAGGIGGPGRMGSGGMMPGIPGGGGVPGMGRGGRGRVGGGGGGGIE